MKTVYIDTETTGLNPPDDEILEVSIIDESGGVLLDTLVKPEKNSSWDDAESIHGISPESVRESPTLSSLKKDILFIVEGNHVVIYNSSFDLAFLPSELSDVAERVSCCMLAFSEHYGAYSETFSSYTWQPLWKAANLVDHSWVGEKHRALSDAFACKAVWEYLLGGN